MSEPAGDFPYTVTLYQPVPGVKDKFGHVPSSYSQVGFAAARIWTVNVSGSSSDPADLVARQPRLLLREPMAGVDIGWRIMWKGKLYQVDAIEDRDWNRLVTLASVNRTQ